MDFTKLTDLLWHPKILAGIAFLGAILTLGSRKLLSRLGVPPFVDEYRPLIGVVTLLSMTVLVAHGAVAGVKLVQAAKRRRDHILDRVQGFRGLSAREKVLLAQFLDAGSKSILLDMKDPEANALVSQGYLYRSGMTESRLDRESRRLVFPVPHVMHHWVWACLVNQPDLIDRR